MLELGLGIRFRLDLGSGPVRVILFSSYTAHTAQGRCMSVRRAL